MTNETRTGTVQVEARLKTHSEECTGDDGAPIVRVITTLDIPLPNGVTRTFAYATDFTPERFEETHDWRQQGIAAFHEALRLDVGVLVAYLQALEAGGLRPTGSGENDRGPEAGDGEESAHPPQPPHASGSPLSEPGAGDGGLVAAEQGTPAPDSLLASEINSLPERVRRFIMDLETNADPAGVVRDLAIRTEQCQALAAHIARYEAGLHVLVAAGDVFTKTRAERLLRGESIEQGKGVPVRPPPPGPTPPAMILD